MNGRHVTSHLMTGPKRHSYLWYVPTADFRHSSEQKTTTEHVGHGTAAPLLSSMKAWQW